MKFFYCDTETTGLRVGYHEITQLAFVVEVNGKVVERQDIYMRPKHVDRIESEALKVTSKKVEDLMAYPPRREGYAKLINTLSKHVNKYDRNDKMIMVGQNIIKFDQPFMRAWFMDEGDKWFGSWFHYYMVDLLSVSALAISQGWDIPNLKLGTVCDKLGIKFKAHDAMGDTEATRQAFHEIASWMKVPPPKGQTSFAWEGKSK